MGVNADQLDDKARIIKYILRKSHFYLLIVSLILVGAFIYTPKDIEAKPSLDITINPNPNTVNI
jgi:hypothetical protein